MTCWRTHRPTDVRGPRCPRLVMLARLRLGPTRPARRRPLDPNLPAASYPSQPRPLTQETTFGNSAQQAARFARGAVWRDRRGSRRLVGIRPLLDQVSPMRLTPSPPNRATTGPSGTHPATSALLAVTVTVRLAGSLRIPIGSRPSCTASSARFSCRRKSAMPRSDRTRFSRAWTAIGP